MTKEHRPVDWRSTLGDIAFVVWVVMWMFTIGIAKLGIVSGAVALPFWPFYLGDVIAMLVAR